MSVVESIRMLDCEILKTDYGVSYGSVTLKSLQNDNVPELDLLVRRQFKTVQMLRYKKKETHMR